MALLEKKFKNELAKAGIIVNGNNSWDIQVHDKRLYSRVILRGSIGLGEAYMDGWWDCVKLDEFFYRILRANLHSSNKAVGQDLFHYISNLFNRQTVSRAFEVGERHYDLGNDLYSAMLDKRMVYTCAYWKNANTLDEAQEAKLDLICRKIGLKKGDHILDIGCGWGSFAKFAAEKYGARVTGVTISKEQVTLGRELTKGLPVDIKLLDYRKIHGTFDHIVSIGMFEHVGRKNYKTFMRIVSEHLKDDGFFLLHTLGENLADIATDPWTEKYIFPNGSVPTMTQISRAIHGMFVVEDWHNFSADYDKTLMAWNKNFNNHWNELEKKYSKRFYRMWSYFLLSFAGAFRARDNQLWQIVMTKRGKIGGYISIR